MDLNRRTVVGLGALALTLPAAAPAPTSAVGDADIALWPKWTPGGELRPSLRPAVTERSTDPNYHDRIAVHTTQPLMTLFRAPQPDGSAMLLIPGGGYKWAVVDKEGVDIARRLTQAGVTCFVLRYRLPADGWRAGPDAPLQDAQRAMRIIRSDAVRYGIDPKRIGVLGASAGGHLAASLMSGFNQKIGAPEDAIDAVDARPDFAALLYPVVTMTDPYVHQGSRTELLGDKPAPSRIDAYSVEKTINGNAPPTFLVHALDDTSVAVDNSLLLAEALRRSKVPLEMHLFEAGGHGFGIRLAEGKPASTWPVLFLNWASGHGFVGKPH